MGFALQVGEPYVCHIVPRSFRRFDHYDFKGKIAALGQAFISQGAIAALLTFLPLSVHSNAPIFWARRLLVANDVVWE